MRKHQLRIFLDQPNPDIYDFVANMQFKFEGKDKNIREKDDLGNLQFIPRGSTIKFSGHVHAFVSYTGVETKLM